MGRKAPGWCVGRAGALGGVRIRGSAPGSATAGVEQGEHIHPCADRADGPGLQGALPAVGLQLTLLLVLWDTWEAAEELAKGCCASCSNLLCHHV